MSTQVRSSWPKPKNLPSPKDVKLFLDINSMREYLPRWRSLERRLLSFSKHSRRLQIMNLVPNFSMALKPEQGTTQGQCETNLKETSNRTIQQFQKIN